MTTTSTFVASQSFLGLDCSGHNTCLLVLLIGLHFHLHVPIHGHSGAEDAILLFANRCYPDQKLVKIVQESELRMMGFRQVILVAMLACVAFTVVESTAIPEVVLRLFGVEGDVRGKACGPQVDIETPACQVVETRGKYELRKYTDSEIWAETLVGNSSYEGATFTGFYRCFNFISGKNSKNMKIEMTGPVHISPAPDAKGYKVAFFVPSRFKTVNDLPTPSDPKVHFYQPGAALKAVIGPFGGFPTDKDYEAKFTELKKALDKDGLKYDESTVTYAGYSSPFQFRSRQQEVHVNVVPL